jgi:hypothetical protein
MNLNDTDEHDVNLSLKSIEKILCLIPLQDLRNEIASNNGNTKKQP